MKESLRIETDQALDLLERHEEAWQHRSYRKAVRAESKQNLYVDTESKVTALEEMVGKALGFRATATHPRVCILLLKNDSAALKNLGTPPVPSSDAQGQFSSRPSRPRGAPVDDPAARRLRQLIFELDLVLQPP
ncbi:hypothetical protein PGT21_019877 [Puccinia graminis f. sp. tritici]|uniref:Uncharacterized protein n=2 Tax=Puccinia graminis f. sp. tritici TaxID=56615 RepID=E3KSI2_PUCGT|nr:uncharacterized protein PGTG_12852 [Puccinia graminis f. sp. tritici CRL 75-36-700-3]EFP87268.1 hypothetical protein PGTG_12852 [Puccinia graminis f. sp. tritici CRL 75-36-700-3]KAA1112008.1 hypothetical protein PGT21_019877 [Puccinia graminis f. sp. tritici]